MGTTTATLTVDGKRRADLDVSTGDLKARPGMGEAQRFLERPFRAYGHMARSGRT
jgi:hypothetical protein